MSVFVDKSKTFKLKIYWTPVVHEGQTIDVEVSSSPKPGWSEFWGEFVSADAETFGKILARTTIMNSNNQVPLLNTHLLMMNVLSRLMVGWSHSDADGNQLPVTEDAIKALNYKVAVALFVQYMNRTKLTPVLKEAIKKEKEVTGGVSLPEAPKQLTAARSFKASSQPPRAVKPPLGG